MNTQRLRSIVLAVVVVPPAMMVACDPGVTIRQAGTLTDTNNSVTLRVKPARQFIGDTRYAPQITVTNSFQAPVAITGVELSAKQRVYNGSSPKPQDWPKTVLPGEKQNVVVLFRLDDDVRTTFKQSAELRVHYRSENGAATATTVIELGPLD